MPHFILTKFKSSKMGDLMDSIENRKADPLEKQFPV